MTSSLTGSAPPLLKKEVKLSESPCDTDTDDDSSKQLPIKSVCSIDSESLSSQLSSSPILSPPNHSGGWPQLQGKPARLHLPKHLSSGENLVISSPNDKVFTQYLPRWVVSHVSRLDPESSVDTFLAEVSASAMCIDIVGFTALTGLLGTSGNAEGADNISQVLNTYFGKVLEVIESFSGDVIQFSGDAIMVLFSNQGCLEQDTIVCIKCAQSISHSLGTSSVSLFGKCVDISLKIGISSGPVSLVVSGGHRGKFIPVVAGKAWANAGVICNECPAGHIAIHGSVAIKISKKKGVFSSTCHGGRIETQSKQLLVVSPPFASVMPPTWNFDLPQLGSEQKQLLKNFIPKNILKGTRNELRSVVTVFVKFCGMEAFPLDSDSLNHYSITVQRLAHRYVGYLNKLLYDDKECFL
eukprot:TRINITY_DN18338_c0_g1_i1.p2 TRINITY_DN18338_c0_g1~~TRINITY_DN18338_c0_g1_i1.p2  ORF type:complete len:411 (+),score=52.39 TRINITY_DN18338_c0_g1_i1:53-1285(+)